MKIINYFDEIKEAIWDIEIRKHDIYTAKTAKIQRQLNIWFVQQQQSHDVHKG